MSDYKFEIGQKVTALYPYGVDSTAFITDRCNDPEVGDVYRIRYTDGTRPLGWVSGDELKEFKFGLTAESIQARLDQIQADVNRGDYEAVSSEEHSLYVDYLKQLAEGGDGLAALVLKANVDCPRW